MGRERDTEIDRETERQAETQRDRQRKKENQLALVWFPQKSCLFKSAPGGPRQPTLNGAHMGFLEPALRSAHMP